ARRAQSTTSDPPSARIFANVVPQLPAPSTAMRRGGVGGALRAVLAIEAAGLLLVVLGGVPALRGSLLAPEVLEQGGDRRHDDGRGLRQGRAVEVAALEGREVD